MLLMRPKYVQDSTVRAGVLLRVLISHRVTVWFSPLSTDGLKRQGETGRIQWESTVPSRAARIPHRGGAPKNGILHSPITQAELQEIRAEAKKEKGESL